MVAVAGVTSLILASGSLNSNDLGPSKYLFELDIEILYYN